MRVGYRFLNAVWTLAAVLLAIPASAQEPDAPPAGQDDLDRATEVHLDARRVQDYDRVINLCERAIEKGLDGPSELFAHELAASTLFQRASFIAELLNRQGRPTEQWLQFRQAAIEDLDRAVEHDPTMAQAWVLMCQLSALPGGDRKRGYDAASRAIEIYEGRQNPRALSEALLLRARFGDDQEQQVADFEAATDADPTNESAWQLRATFLLEAGLYEDAAAAFEQLIADSPDNPALRLALAEALGQLEGDDAFEQALEQIDAALDIDPDLSNAYTIRARLRVGREQYDRAIDDLSEAVRLNPEDLGALLFRAEIYLFQNEIERAREDVNQALAGNPGLVYGIRLRSRINAADGNYERAIEDAELLVENDPQDVDMLLTLAAYLNANDQPRKAVALVDELLDVDPENWRALRSRGDALLSIGKHEEAVADYEKALELQPEESGLLNNLAWVLATSPEDDLRDGERAIELATRACELTDYEEAHILSTLASGYAEAGDFEEAIRWATKAVELGEGEMKEQLQEELDSYREGNPWRELQETEEKPSERSDLIET